MGSESIQLQVGKVIIGDGSTQEDVNIGINRGIIKEISQEKLESKYSKSIDFSKKFAMPGLIDAHVHIRYGSEFDIISPSLEYQSIRGLINARKALLCGVTSLADAGGVGNTVFAVRNAINDGVAWGPRVFASGEMITMTGGRSKIPGVRVEVDGEDSARKAARSLLMYHGADFIKLGATGALSSPHTGPRHPQLTVEEMKACVEEAHKCGKKVHAHCYGEQGISNALESDVDVIVHGQSLSDKHISIMNRDDKILLPTLKTFCDVLELSEEEKRDSRIIMTGIWEETRPNFEKALKNGVIIGMGTDAGMPNNLFGDNIIDLFHMVSWGMMPMDAIIAGSLNAAKSLAIDDQLGTLEVGKYADILILGKDPTENIHYLDDSIEKIMLEGKFIDPKSNY